MPTNPEDSLSSSPEISPQEAANQLFPSLKPIDERLLLPSQGNTEIKLEERQEQTRAQLATTLIRILAGTLVGSFILIITLIIMSIVVDEKRAVTLEKNNTLAKDLITFIITSQTGLIGTALGFYFGSRSRDSD